MKLEETSLPGVLLVEPKVHEDCRGFFLETYHAARYAEAAIAQPFVQDNLSYSMHGVLRGLHAQHPCNQAKLVYVLQGEVFDVAVDVRSGSPHFGKWTGVLLSESNRFQLYIPEGFAHGFCVVSETALFAYKCTELYAASAEFSVAWNDPDIGISWPIETPTLSAKDAAAPRLRDIGESRLPRFEREDL